MAFKAKPLIVSLLRKLEDIERVGKATVPGTNRYWLIKGTFENKSKISPDKTSNGLRLQTITTNSEQVGDSITVAHCTNR